MRLTNQTAAALQIPAGKPYTIVFDDELPGFGMKASSGGSRVWLVQYRNALGQSKRETLGRVGLLSATDARKAAAERLARAKLGEDPHSERQAAKRRAAITFGSFVEPYLAAAADRLRATSLREVERYLRITWKVLHPTPVHAVTRSQVAARIIEIAKESGPYASNRARAALSGYFSWLIGNGHADANPVIGTLKATMEERRSRVLMPAEIGRVLKACRADDFGRIVRLLLLTGQRRDEVAAMRWSEVDLAGGIWRLDEQRTKNALPHDIPLAAEALEVLAAAARLEGRETVFGRGDTGFKGFSKAKADLDERSGVSGWRLHDLRRTAATGMANLGVLPHVVEAVLNHISGSRAGVAGIYNRATYATEKRAALDLWGRHLAALDPGVEVATADPEAPLAKPKKRRPVPRAAKPAKRRRREA